MTVRTDPSRLLEQADRLLSGDINLMKSHGVRGACWLARSALEGVVHELLGARAWDPGTASMRSSLTCLDAAYADRPSVSQTAQYAWMGLSGACHHHAFELAPTAFEARHLVELVRRLDGVRHEAADGVAARKG